MMIGKRLSTTRKFVLAFALGFGALAPAPDAWAGPKSGKPAAPAKDPAVELFESANKLFAEKKYDAALVLFRRAYEQSRSPNARLMIGRCLLEQGKLTEAYDELSATLRESATRAETEAKYAQTRDAAATEIGTLEAKVGKVVVTLVDAPEGARVLLGGVALGQDKLGVPLAVMPGDVSLTAEGFPGGTVNRTETVKPGETKVVVFGSKPAEKPVETTTTTPIQPPPPVVPPPVEMTGGGLRKAGFAVLAVGVAGMGAFAFGGIQGNQKFAQLEKECGNVRCTDPKYGDIVDSGKTMDLVANIGLGVGAAGIVAGTAMILFGGPKPKTKTTEASLFISPGQSMLQVRHRF